MPINDAPTRLAGIVDDFVYGGGLFDGFETVPDLVYPLSVQTFDRMRHDPQLAGVLNAITLPIRQGATWAVDPAGCRDEVAQLVADDLGLPVLGSGDEPGPARRRGVRWSEHLRLALLKIVYGHMPFEHRFEIIAGRARLAELAERMPSSITEIKVGDDGSLAGIRQGAPNAPLIGTRRLTYHVHAREGSAWQGRSVLRAAFGAWLYKHEMLRVLATSNRRFGMGIPEVEAPPGATPAQVIEAQRLASAMRVGDQSGVGVPNGFRFKLTGLSGSTPDTLGFIRYLDEQMSKQALAGVLDLGQTPNGSRALGSELVDLMLLAWQSLADDIADTETAETVVRMVDYNWGEDEPAPRVVAHDIGSRPEITAEALGVLIEKGAIKPDRELEAFVRERWQLPRRDEQAGPPPPSSPPPAAAGRGRRVRGAAPPLRRQPTVVEAAAKTDFAAVQDEWESALDKLVNDWAKITKAQRRQLVDQVRAAVTDEDVDALATLAVDSRDAAELLADRMVELAEDAAIRMAEEAEAQDVDTDPGEPDEARLTSVAATIAALAGSGLAASAARKALQLWTPGATADQVAAGVRQHLESLTDAALRDNLGAALSTAQNAGRIATLQVAPAAAVYAASEILDASTCSRCADFDGHRFDSLTDAEQAYANGGYVDCLGGLRCRGIIVTVWDASALEEAA